MNRVVKLPLGQSVVPTGKRVKVRDLPSGGYFIMHGHGWQVVLDDDINLLGLDSESHDVSWDEVKDSEVDEGQFQEPWVAYQPHRQREKEYYDIKLRDGTVVECCYPNGVHWHPMFGCPKGVGQPPFADHRVIQIRKCRHPLVMEEMA